jgi:hypothetical protein
MILEIALVISGVLASFTLCAVKILHQVQNSKCKFITCCGSQCIRDVEIDLPEASVSNVQQPVVPTRVSTPRQEPKKLPRPRIKELQQIFENK